MNCFNTWSHHSLGRKLLKTLLEMEEILTSSIFPQRFISYQRKIVPFEPHLNCHLQVYNLDKSIFLSCSRVNPLPHDKILDWSKLEAFADDQRKWNLKLKICFWKDGNHFGKRRNCWLLAFSPFPKMLRNASFLRTIKFKNLDFLW